MQALTPWQPAALLLLSCASSALAAGGHHAVDDASILEPGQCDLELWRELGGGRRLDHLGPICRLGPMELGLSLDQQRPDGLPRLRSLSPQLKWAQPLGQGWSWGWVLAASWQAQRPHGAGSSLLLPLSWQHGDWALHLNLGRDFHPGRPDAWRRGLALEWSPTPALLLMAEHFHDGESPQQRLGLRYAVNERWSLDLSRARPVASAPPGWWTLGLTWGFRR